MATQPPRRVLEPLAAPQHYMPPSGRELRAQAVQRLQAGLFGVAAIILVVGLASIINARAQEAALAGQSPASPSASASPHPNTDPLAEAGVVPSSAPEASVAVQPSPIPAPAPAQQRPGPTGQSH